jgi:outer membrane protease
MKNITALAVLVIMVSTAYCQEKPAGKNYGFSISPQFGFVYGQVLELVYPAGGETKGEFFSELTWDMKPVFYIGFQADFGRADLLSAPGIFATVNLKTGIPADSGKMEDRDWLSTENAGLTHFSSHTNRTRQFTALDIAAGASIPLGSYFYIKPFLSFSWTRFAFAGRDGYGQYARSKITGVFSREPGPYNPIDDNPVMESYEGRTVITYEQNWFLFAAGISAGMRLPYDFALALSFQISPFSYCTAVDRHTGGSTFNDFTYGKLYLEPALSLSYSIKQVELSLNCSYRYIAKTKGNSYINQNTNPDKNKAGAGLSLWDTRLLVKINLF